MLTESVELVGEGGLELLARDVGKLSFGDQRLGLGADELLLEHDDFRAVGFFVFKLRNLIGDLLLACSIHCQHPCPLHRKFVARTVAARLDRRLDVADALDGHAVLIVAVDILVLEFTNLVYKNTKLVRDIGDIVVAGLSPDGQLLLRTNVRYCVSRPRL